MFNEDDDNSDSIYETFLQQLRDNKEIALNLSCNALLFDFIPHSIEYRELY
jgi:hypothetical protein